MSINNIEKCFSKLFLTTNTLTTCSSISWNGYKPGIIKGISYPREYQILLDSRQYSYLLQDGSFFQFYFDFDSNGDLSKSRLAYYPIPKIIGETLEDILEYEETANPWLKDVYSEMALEMEYNSGQLSANSHIRFDFDSKVVTHSKAHLQFGGINCFRITSSVLVLPLIFMEKILIDFHKDWLIANLDFSKIENERVHSTRNCFKFDEKDCFFLTN